MARTIQDRFFSTTIPSGTVGLNPALALVNELEARMDAFLSNGVIAWQEITTGISGSLGNYDKILDVSLWIAVDARVRKTVGDRNINNGDGDTVCYVAFDPLTTTSVRFAAGHDWSTPDKNIVTAQTSTPIISPLQVSTDMNVYGAINEYEGIIIVNQTTAWWFVWWGVPVRKQVPQGHRGTAFTTAAVTGGIGAQQISVNGDLSSSLVVGQNVWIVPQTADGDALETPTIEELSVISVGADFVELNPANNYAAGALIGLDPCPVLFSASASSLSGAASVGEDRDFATARIYTPRVATGVGEAQVDPSALGFYRGYRMEFEASFTGAASYRGVPSLIALWSSDATPQSWANGDFNRDNFDDTRKFAPFPDFTGLVSYEINLGPFENAL